MLKRAIDLICWAAVIGLSGAGILFARAVARWANEGL
jgi:hypothetical protein